MLLILCMDLGSDKKIGVDFDAVSSSGRRRVQGDGVSSQENQNSLGMLKLIIGDGKRLIINISRKDSSDRERVIQPNPMK